MEQTDVYKIVISLVTLLVACGGVFGWLIVRMVKTYDKQISELFDRTKDLPAIRTDIEWIKDLRNKK